jgi:glycolate oxidase FAD binding subunit
MRLEGFAPSVAHRQAALMALVERSGAVALIEGRASQELWRALRDVTPFAAARTGVETPLWRISTAPAKGAVLTRMIAGSATTELLYDWAGGLVWALIHGSEDAGASAVRNAVAACGGHATLIRAPAALRAAAAVFEPQVASLTALTTRVKQGFDPRGVLNPGRMWAGV